MAYPVVLLPGDGIGPEVVEATLRVLGATGVTFAWERYEDVGAAAVEQGEEPLPERVVEAIRKTKVALKGPITTPVGEGFKSVNVQLRQKLDLYANVRPCRSLPGIQTPFSDVDLIIFRENTEGLYSGIETYDERLEIADSIARVTRAGSERIVRFCLAYAQRHSLKKVTLAHKANILKQSGGLFLRTGYEVAEAYPDVQFNDRIIDNLCLQLVTRPEQFQCIVTTNLFGDIISDLCAGLVGGLGVVPGANIGNDCAVFEAVHGSAPDIAGQGKANPTALIRSAEMLLRHLGETAAADAVLGGLEETLREGTHLTADLGGTASTSAFTERLCDHVATRVAA